MPSNANGGPPRGRSRINPEVSVMTHAMVSPTLPTKETATLSTGVSDRQRAISLPFAVVMTPPLRPALEVFVIVMTFEMA